LSLKRRRCRQQAKSCQKKRESHGPDCA
jgi:hypothetical protein